MSFASLNLFVHNQISNQLQLWLSYTRDPSQYYIDRVWLIHLVIDCTLDRTCDICCAPTAIHSISSFELPYRYNVCYWCHLLHIARINDVEAGLVRMKRLQLCRRSTTRVMHTKRHCTICRDSNSSYLIDHTIVAICDACWTTSHLMKGQYMLIIAQLLVDNSIVDDVVRYIWRLFFLPT